ncbi:MAG TPA: nucleotide exchange factor GrpE [Steroidobacteraceae bacterium]|nr:nucleotide exchange factor GrpE [Steroidobacteraceae bacterium]
MSDPSVPAGDRAGAGAATDPEATTVLADDPFQGEVAALEAALAAANAKAAQNYDQYVRALAEFDNYRRRAARDLDAAQRYALERFAQELLPALDGFELALANAAAPDVKSLIEGQAATHRLLMKAFEKAGIAELDPTGQPFNPEQHEAMVAQPTADQPPNTVLQTVQKGYLLNGRVLRPARVIVSRAPDA